MSAALLAYGPAARAASREDAPKTAGEAERELRRVTITANPLAVVVGRYGANVEVLPARHHAFIASAYLQTFSLTMVRPFLGEYESRVRDSATSAAGGELGYRIYSGGKAAEGAFIGPSFVVLPLAYARTTPGGPGDLTIELAPYHAYGAAIDVGAQAVTDFGLTIGGGVGAMVLAHRFPSDPSRLPLDPAPPVLPRLLFTVGYSF